MKTIIRFIFIIFLILLIISWPTWRMCGGLLVIIIFLTYGALAWFLHLLLVLHVLMLFTWDLCPCLMKWLLLDLSLITSQMSLILLTTNNMIIVLKQVLHMAMFYIAKASQSLVKFFSRTCRRVTYHYIKKMKNKGEIPAQNKTLTIHTLMHKTHTH